MLLHKILIYLFLAFSSIHATKVFAQPDYITTSSSKDTIIKSIRVIADKNYSFEQILKDTTLHFAKQ